jgi:hypothetical protein
VQIDHKNESLLAYAKRAFIASEDGHFALDTIRNSFWFCVIGLVALGLQTFVGWTEANGGGTLLVWLLTAVEYAILIADVIWFLSRLAVGTYRVVLRARSEIARMRSGPLDSTHEAH